MHDHAEAWGSPDREYAFNPDAQESHSNRDARPLEEINHQLSLWRNAVRNSFGGDPRVVVDRTVKQWNGVVREFLRKQTGLRLSTDRESNRAVGRNPKMRSVPIRVVSELPVRFAREVQELKPQEIELLMHKSKLQDVNSGTAFILKEYPALSKIEVPCVAKSDEIKSVNGFAKALLDYIEKHDEFKRILNMDEDVLGAYFFRTPEIRLYWVVIGVYSQLLDIPIEALTVVVLVHELAHAYTHLGYDIDNRAWNTEEFAQADLHLVEGLAQFYTMVICEQIAQRFPIARDAFEKLLENQSDEYREHQRWIGNGVSEHVGETIRISMLECRSKGVSKRKEFQDIVKHYQGKFRKNQPLFQTT